MIYDLYVELGGESQQDVDALVKGEHRGVSIPDIATRIRLLAGIAARDERVKDYAVSGDRRDGGGYKSLVHAKDPKASRYARELIAREQTRLNALGLLAPTSPDLRALPLGSWFLQFTFTLAKPYISKDDDPFYVAESINAVRKDKVFKVPMMSAASWKGLLRWAAMQTRLFAKRDQLSDQQFAQERFKQTFFFGDEKGEELGKAKEWTAYLDSLKPSARANYEQILKQYFDLDEDAKELPHHAGRLLCYPTFFDLIDVEVINPHSRKTKAGTHPIYLECVPAGARGAFSLLYVPFDLIGREEDAARQAKEDLQIAAEAIGAMMLTYGFSAKRTSGYGTAEDKITGEMKTREGARSFKDISFSRLVEEVEHVAF